MARPIEGPLPRSQEPIINFVEMFCNMLAVYTRLEDNPLPTVQDCMCSMFDSTFHV
jgi:hypothetical protein